MDMANMAEMISSKKRINSISPKMLEVDYFPLDRREAVGTAVAIAHLR